MIILLTKDEDKELIIVELQKILNSEESRKKLSDKMMTQTGLSYSDLKYLLDIYILEERRRDGEQVSTISYKDE